MMHAAYPHWVFDDSEIPDPLGFGDRAVRFLKCLKHPASTAPKKAFQLYPWQERIVRRIYGPRDNNGRMVVQNVFLLMPRGNRKTSLAAGLALLHTIGPERVPGGQVIFAAADRKQAGIAFRESANILREDKRLINATTIYDAQNSPKEIVMKKDDVRLVNISSDGGAAHGLTPRFCLVDELHVWKGRDLWEALRSGSAKVDDSLTIIATTAGRGTETVASEQYAYALEVARGNIENPAYLPILFQAEPDDDWKDEKVWHKANPGLKYGFPSLTSLRALAKEAENRPSDKAAFKQFNLNVWQQNSRDPLFEMATYDAQKFEEDESELEELPCWLGVDLALNGDTAAVVAAWKHPDDQLTVKPWFFVPGEDLRGRADRDGVPYDLWAEQGLVTATPGDIIDQALVEERIRELAARHQVAEIVFDPHLAKVLMQRLYADCLPVLEFRQCTLNMGMAAGALERTVNGRMIRHDGHPVLRKHFENVVVSRNDTTGLIRMHKGKKTDRIDGAISSAMAIYRAIVGECSESSYNKDPNAEIFVF